MQSVFGLLVLLSGTLGLNHFEIDGHFSAISVQDVQENPTNRLHFSASEERLRQRLLFLFDNQLVDFFIESFSIHGEDLHPSAIFTAYLSTSLSRSTLIQLISKEEDLDVFRVRALLSLPPSPPLQFAANSTIATYCLNGGFLLPNSTCSCPAFFTGLNCEIINCYNGILDKGRCSCPPGAYGLNCEPRGCLPSIQAAVDVTKQSFILVINQKSTMAYVLNEIANLLGPTLNGFFASSRYDNFIVVNYVHTKNALSIQKNAFSSIAEMVDYLNTIVFSVQGMPLQPTNRAALAAQSFHPYMKPLSNIYVFVDSLDTDAGPAEFTLASNTIENQLILRTISWRNRLVYFFSEQPKTDHSTDGDGFETFHRVAKTTLGDLFNYLVTDVDTIINLLPFYQGTESVAALYDITNSLNLEIKLPIAKSDGEAQVLVTVPAGDLPHVTDSTRKPLSILANGTGFAMYQTSNTNPYIILHTGGKRVNVRVWVDSVDTMFLTNSDSPFFDTGYSYLAESYSNVVSALLTGNQIPPLTLQWISSSSQNTLSNVIAGNPRRSDCTYPWSFGQMTKCQPGSLIQHVTFVTNEGSVVNRLIPGYCLEMEKIIPTFQCMNGGTRAGGNSCRCTADWEGNQCQIPVCSYGGKPNPFPGNGNGGPCLCQPGYSGDHCNILSCTVPPSNDFPPSTTTLAVIMQSSLSQAQNGPNVEAGVASLLKAMQGKDQYDQFILTTFSYQRVEGEDKDLITTTSFSDPVFFQNAVNNVKYLPTPSTSQDPLAAIMMTLSNTSSFYNSAMFLVLDSQPKTTTSEPDVLRLAVERNVPINIILTAPFGMMNKCPPFSTQQFYEQLAIKTGGIIMNLCQKTGEAYQNAIHDLFVAYAASHHGTEVLNENFFNDFEISGGLNLFFRVDQPTNDVFLIVNCPRTEKFDTRIRNYDLNVNPFVYSIVNIPFVAVYKVPTSAVNKQGYLANVARDAFDTNDGPCFIQALIKSKHSTILRFSPNPAFDAFDQSLEFAVPINPVVHVNNDKLNRTYLPVLMANDDKDRSFDYQDYPLSRTSSCNYEFFFRKTFTCNKPSDSFTFRFSGTNLDGNGYMRSFRAFCYLQPGKCANGGYVLSNGLCKCPPAYGGLYCQSPKCENNFPLDTTDFTCECGQQYTGSMCEYPVCDAWNYMESVDPRSNTPKQITFVLNRNSDSLLVNIQLSNAIQSIVAATESQNVPVIYTLLTYDQYSVQRVISTSHVDLFVQTFQSTVNNIQRVTSLVTMSIDALVAAWELNIQPPGIIYLFLGTPSQIPNANAFDTYLEQKINTQVNVFYAPQMKSNPYEPLPIDQQTSVLYQAVRQSGGRMLSLTQNSISQIAPLLISATKHKEVILDEGLDRCIDGCQFVVFVESNFNSVELTLTGVDIGIPGRVAIVTSLGVTLPINADTTLFSDNQVLVLRFNSSQVEGGEWYVRCRTTINGATVQARIDSDIRLYLGFTINKFDDFVHQVPFTGLGLNRSTYMTFRLVDGGQEILFPHATVGSVNIYRTNFAQPTLDGEEVSTIYAYPRDFASCTYQYVSQEWVVDLSSQQKFIVSGHDANGYTFKRNFFYQFAQFSQRGAKCGFYGKPNQYGECICTSNWTGDFCQKPVCKNGGTQSYGICICPNGFFGEYCENHVIS